MSEELELCGICQDEESTQNKLPCQGCGFLFCEVCVLYWKITKDECPRRCCRPWRIELPPQRDCTIGRADDNKPNSESPLQQDLIETTSAKKTITDAWGGFIQCPRCSRLGCLYCSNISCRRKLTFTDITDQHSLVIPQCSACPQQMLRLYKSMDHRHPPCTKSNPLYYWFCPNCEQKFCC